jgi:hypothetical protein
MDLVLSCLWTCHVIALEPSGSTLRISKTAPGGQRRSGPRARACCRRSWAGSRGLRSGARASIALRRQVSRLTIQQRFHCQRRRMTSAFRLARRVAALLSSTVFRAACASERHDRHGALRGQPGGRGRGREPLSMATKVKTASVTLICASPSRDRRQASTWNFIDVRPVETRSA